MNRLFFIVLSVATGPLLLGLWVDAVSCRANFLRARNAFSQRAERTPSPVPVVGLVLYLLAYLVARELRPCPAWVEAILLAAVLFHCFVHLALPAAAACLRSVGRRRSAERKPSCETMPAESAESPEGRAPSRPEGGSGA